jgi:hypothetical protein
MLLLEDLDDPADESGVVPEAGDDNVDEIDPKWLLPTEFSE